jgi:hypothetical protein
VDVYEFATTANFPATGASAVIYIATDTGKTYRWAGSVYMELGQIGGAGGALSASVTIPGLGDASYSSVALLLHGDGNLTDSSANNVTITANGSATYSSAQTKWGSGSLYFPGAANDYLSVPAGVVPSGTNDFTIEGWIYPQSWNNSGALILQTGLNGIQIGRYGSFNSWGIAQAGVAWLINDVPFTALNTWTHIAIVRQSNTIKIYVNGAQAGSTYSGGPSFANQTGLIGGDSGGSCFQGYIDDFRITNVARYTSAYTPPITVFPDTSSLTLPVSVSGTGSGLSLVSAPASATSTGTAGQIAYDGAYLYVATGSNAWARAALSSWDPLFSSVTLLLHCDGADGGTTFTDSSAYAQAATRIGSAQTSTAQSKFGGASLLLNGTTDYLRFPSSDNFYFSGDFTVEAWIRLSAYPSSYEGDYGAIIISRDDGSSLPSSLGWNFGVFGSSAQLLSLGLTSTSGTRTLMSGTANFALNTWYHVAAVRSGNTVYLYKDGVLLNSGGTSYTSALANNTATLKVGALDYDVTYKYWFPGNIDEVRITTAARYTSAFTPPTAAFPNP